MHQIDVAGNERDLLGREWLLTNGTGSYAMGTLPGVNTRRYHGLLVAATRPPVGRRVLLNQMLEQLVIQSPEGAQIVDLSSCAFRDDHGQTITAPQGVHLLRRFDRGLSVAWAYAWGHVEFVREVTLHWGEPAVTVRYVVAGLAPKEQATLRLQPLVTLRDFHGLPRHLSSDDDVKVSVHDGGKAVTLQRWDTKLTLQCLSGFWRPRSDWWFGLHYPMEAERGLDHTEDGFVPGAFEQDIVSGSPTEVLFTAVLGDQPVEAKPEPDAKLRHLQPIRDRLGSLLPADLSDLDAMFAVAGDDFVAHRTAGDKTLSTILAGYPWFADWGRDTFIALPGLMLETGRHAEAHDTLRAYASVIQDGLVPNRFDDYDASAGGAHYNSVDASLWYIRAALLYMNATKDQQAWNDWLGAAIRKIIEGYIRGAGPDIRMAGDGMIVAGNVHTQLTWMDAKCDGVVFTPRQGKAVEINALWHHALAGVSEQIKDSDRAASQHYRKLSERIRRSFIKVFWDDDLNCLRDHVWTSEDGSEEHADRSIRPNQIFAASLEYSPIPRTRQRQVVQAVKDRLLTPVGLRTLTTCDRHYHGQYTGGPFQRDEAYHQGTIWPWLMGPYAEAVLRAGQFSAEARAEARQAIEPLIAELRGPGLGQLHEIHEADAPHRAVGCMAQAWSIGELIRVLALLHSPGKAAS
ncbi:MAG: glycogen debranching enzyme family protein [Phycisphaeraceae bacterium]|nr:glycogen debranching enzyme family protein [Phycisphaeraceae bacterium]